jgi:hypothetical protein
MTCTIRKENRQSKTGQHCEKGLRNAEKRGLQVAIELVHDAGDLSIPVVDVLEALLAPEDLPLRQAGTKNFTLSIKPTQCVDRPLALREHLDRQVLLQGARIQQVVVEGLVHAEAPALLVGKLLGGVGIPGLLHAHRRVALLDDQLGLQHKITGTSVSGKRRMQNCTLMLATAYVNNDGVSLPKQNTAAGNDVGPDLSVDVLAITPQRKPAGVGASVNDPVGMSLQEHSEIVVRRSPIVKFVLERIGLEQHIAEVSHHNVRVLRVLGCPGLVSIVARQRNREIGGVVEFAAYITVPCALYRYQVHRYVI